MKSYISEEALQEAAEMEATLAKQRLALHSRRPSELVKLFMERYRLDLFLKDQSECDTYSALCDVTNMLIGCDVSDYNQYIQSKRELEDMDWYEEDVPQTTWYMLDDVAPTWRLWGEEKVEGAVYTVYLKKVRYHLPSPSATQDSDSEDDISHLEWETVRVWFLKAGTLQKLVESLSSSETGQLESTFVSVFLATYRTFASTERVLQLILERYSSLLNTNNNNINVPEELREEHLKALRQTIQVWLDTYPDDFRHPPQYTSLHTLKQFTAENLRDSDLDVKVTYKMEKILKEDSEKESGLVSCDDVIIDCTSFNGKDELSERRVLSPKGVLPRNSFSSFTAIPTVLCANQLTRMDMVLFRNVVCHQCLGSVWGRRDKSSKGGKGSSVSSVSATVNQFNAVSYRVQSTILINSDLKHSERAKLIVKWIDICQELRILKNFSSLKAITAGLHSNSIFRLKRTWAVVPREKSELFEELARIFSEENNRLNQRDLLMREGTAKHAQTAHSSDRHLPKAIEKHANNPLAVNHGTIPYLGTFLTDLMMIDTAIPDTVHEGLINFDKKRKEFEVLAQIRLLQGAAGAYQIEHDSAFESFWESMLVLDDEESWRLSCAIEPYEPLNSSAALANKNNKKRLNHLGHRKNDSVASTSSGSSFLDSDSIATAHTQESPAPLLNRKMSTGSTTSSQPSLDASLHSTTSITTTSPSTEEPVYPIHLHSNSLSNTSMTSQHSNNSGSQMSVSQTPSSAKSASSGGSSTAASLTPSNNPYITPDFYVIKVSLESSDACGGVLYKSVMVNNSDRTAAVVKAAMEKHGIDHPVDDYTLAQLLPHGEMIMQPSANVYYAISTVHQLNFILRRRRHGDENTLLRRHADTKARKKLPV